MYLGLRVPCFIRTIRSVPPARTATFSGLFSEELCSSLNRDWGIILKFVKNVGVMDVDVHLDLPLLDKRF